MNTYYIFDNSTPSPIHVFAAENETIALLEFREWMKNTGKLEEYTLMQVISKGQNYAEIRSK